MVRCPITLYVLLVVIVVYCKMHYCITKLFYHSAIRMHYYYIAWIRYHSGIIIITGTSQEYGTIIPPPGGQLRDGEWRGGGGGKQQLCRFIVGVLSRPWGAGCRPIREQHQGAVQSIPGGGGRGGKVRPVFQLRESRCRDAVPSLL